MTVREREGKTASPLLARASQAGVKDVAESCARCFPAGTLVATQHGLRAIQTLHAGDRVLAENPTTGKVEAEPVQAVLNSASKP